MNTPSWTKLLGTEFQNFLIKKNIVLKLSKLVLGPTFYIQRVFSLVVVHCVLINASNDTKLNAWLYYFIPPAAVATFVTEQPNVSFTMTPNAVWTLQLTRTLKSVPKKEEIMWGTQLYCSIISKTLILIFEGTTMNWGATFGYMLLFLGGITILLALVQKRESILKPI